MAVGALLPEPRRGCSPYHWPALLHSLRVYVSPPGAVAVAIASTTTRCFVLPYEALRCAGLKWGAGPFNEEPQSELNFVLQVQAIGAQNWLWSFS